MFSIILNIVLALALIAMCLLYLRLSDKLDSVRRTSARLIAKLNRELATSREACAAYEKGIEETTDNYENDFLDFKEQIRHLENELKSYMAENEVLQVFKEVHDEHCLPILNIDSLVVKRLGGQEIQAL